MHSRKQLLENSWSVRFLNRDIWVILCSTTQQEICCFIVELRWFNMYETSRLPNFYKLRDSSYFRIFRGSILRFDLVIIPKDGRNQFSGRKFGPKVPKFPKLLISRATGCRKLFDPSKWPQDLIYYDRSETCLPLR